MKTYDILSLFRECVAKMPQEVYDEFSYWCLGKNDADVLDISSSLDEYLDKVRSILNGTYNKPYRYVNYTSLDKRYSALYKEYWPTTYDRGFMYKLRKIAYYENNNFTCNPPFSFFLGISTFKNSKPLMTFNNLRSNCCFILILNDRFSSFADFCLLKTAAFWTEFFNENIMKLGNNYVFLFNFANKKKIYTFDYLPDGKEITKYKLHKYDNSIIDNMIYDNSRIK